MTDEELIARLRARIERLELVAGEARGAQAGWRARAEAAEAQIAALTAQVERISEPHDPGDFVGDIFYGHPVKTTMGTHRWTGSEWVALPSEAEALAGLLELVAGEALVKERDALIVGRDMMGRLWGKEKARAEAAEAQIAALTAHVERLEASLRKAEQDFYEAANRFQDEDYEGPHEKFTVNVVCHIKPYFDMNMKHLRDSAAAARSALATEEGHD